jgi:hypothetical protein
MWTKNYGSFSPKFVTKLSKIWVWDPRSGIRKNLFRIPDPGVKKAPDPGSGSATQGKIPADNHRCQKHGLISYSYYKPRRKYNMFSSIMMKEPKLCHIWPLGEPKRRPVEERCWGAIKLSPTAA